MAAAAAWSECVSSVLSCAATATRSRSTAVRSGEACASASSTSARARASSTATASSMSSSRELPFFAGEGKTKIGALSPPLPRLKRSHPRPAAPALCIMMQ